MKGPSAFAHSLRCLLLAGPTCFLGACNGDGGTGPAPDGQPPLEIESRAPAAGAQDVPVGATIEVVFNQEIDPATLSDASFEVASGGASLPLAMTYDDATRTARAAAPLLPGASYAVEVSTAVRTPADSGLSAPEQWSFTTQTWEPTTVDDTPGAGTYSSVAIDADGRVHVSYRNSTDATLEYATCLSDCTSAAGWQALTIASAASVAEYTSLAVDADRRIHVSYRDGTGGDLRYVTCGTNCTVAANWDDVAVQLGGDVGLTSSLGVDATGRVHISHYDAIDGNLEYVTCAGDCADQGAWQGTTVDQVDDVGALTSLVVDDAGNVHVTYYDLTGGDLEYASCAGDCHLFENWMTETVDSEGDVGTAGSLYVSGSGRLHVSYVDQTLSDPRYATCAAACTSAANWEVVTVDAGDADVGEVTSIAVGTNGRVHMTYHDEMAGALRYATCATNCALAGSWRATAAADGGGTSSLAVDDAGDVHVAYSVLLAGELRYIR